MGSLNIVSISNDLYAHIKLYTFLKIIIHKIKCILFLYIAIIIKCNNNNVNSKKDNIINGIYAMI